MLHDAVSSRRTAYITQADKEYLFHFECKDSAKFRVSEEKANIFALLSVRNLFKLSEMPNNNAKKGHLP
jgi:hypothetical protein